jgi:hypothetical protein
MTEDEINKDKWTTARFHFRIDQHTEELPLPWSELLLRPRHMHRLCRSSFYAKSSG